MNTSDREPSTIRVQNISFSYAQVNSRDILDVLEKVNFEVTQGGYYALVGPSGCGKTTLLACLAGLNEAYKGTIDHSGKSPEKLRIAHKVGFVFQKPIFMEWKSVLGNVAMATLIAESENSEEKALDWLKKTGLVAFARAYPHELSGGMLARVAIARAFVHMPDLVFLDEAFGNLDESLRDKTNLLIQDIWMDHRPTIFSVTHSISEAVLFSDKVIVLSNKPAKVLRIFDVPFSRPRMTSLRSNNQFISLTEDIRRELEFAHEKTGHG